MSIDQVKASLERLEELFVWGHLNEQDYLARRRHLEDLSAELLPAPATLQIWCGCSEAPGERSSTA